MNKFHVLTSSRFECDWRKMFHEINTEKGKWENFPLEPRFSEARENEFYAEMNLLSAEFSFLWFKRAFHPFFSGFFSYLNGSNYVKISL